MNTMLTYSDVPYRAVSWSGVALVVASLAYLVVARRSVPDLRPPDPVGPHVGAHRPAPALGRGARVASACSAPTCSGSSARCSTGRTTTSLERPGRDCGTSSRMAIEANHAPAVELPAVAGLLRLHGEERRVHRLRLLPVHGQRLAEPQPGEDARRRAVDHRAGHHEGPLRPAHHRSRGRRPQVGEDPPRRPSRPR